MQLAVYSPEGAKGWTRGGKNIEYCKTELCSGSRHFNRLSFSFDFSQPGQTVYFAPSFPYSYSELQHYLNRLEVCEKINKFCVRKTLCKTLAGNNCDYVTISDVSSEKSKLFKKKIIILTARAHPSETVGSHIIQGIIDFLIDTEEPDAEILRQAFIFKIVPMLNPDGVINGNSRCSLAGCDLNRQWEFPNEQLHPTVFYLKRLIEKNNECGNVGLFCDFHGHSNMKGSFVYGCPDPRNPQSIQLFPKILSNICSFFSFEKSKFGISKGKKGTSRVVVHRMLGIPEIFTLETSLCGDDVSHFTLDDLHQIGRDFCRSLLHYYELSDEPASALNADLAENEKNSLKQLAIREIMESPLRIDEDEESEGSESEENLPHSILRCILAKSKQIECNPKIMSTIKKVFEVSRRPQTARPREIKSKMNKLDNMNNTPEVFSSESKRMKNKKYSKFHKRQYIIFSIDATTQTEETLLEYAEILWNTPYSCSKKCRHQIEYHSPSKNGVKQNKNYSINPFY